MAYNESNGHVTDDVAWRHVCYNTPNSNELFRNHGADRVVDGQYGTSNFYYQSGENLPHIPPQKKIDCICGAR